MYISRLSIRNFRNFRNVSLEFQPGVNTIIGENGSGKSNLLYALRLLIDDNLPRGIRFSESDFNRTLSSFKGHWIIIQIEFADLDENEEAQSIAMHKAGTMDEFENKTGAYSLFFRPRENKRRELYDYSLEGYKTQEALSDILESFSLNDYEVTYRGRGNTNFSSDEEYLEYVGDFENIVFPNPDDQRDDVYGTRLHGFSIPNELSCTFIKALRDVESDLRSYRDNPLLNLLRGKEKTIELEKKDNIIKKVVELNDDITDLKEVKDVSIGISDSIRQAVGETYAPNISIKSEVPEDIERLLQSLKLWVGDPDEIGHKGRIWELSLGGANLIYLSLKLLEYEKVKSLDKIANFLLIEEPEAHIHTHIQKTLFQKLHGHDTQIIITTHSTHISSVSKISSVNVLSRSKKEVVVFSPSNGLEAPEIRALERYLDAVRTTLLFAKGVILVEGDAEQMLIPELIKKAFGVSLDEMGISLVNIGSTGFKNVAVIFDDKRIQKKCAIITDLDTSILELPVNSIDDNVEEKACRNSQISGEQRKGQLDDFCKKNKWVKPFYGHYTFEVDFLLCGNQHEVKETIKKKYSRGADRDRINKLIDDEDISISGKEILRLANAIGKGWFAILLSENLTHLTCIPNHILEAIAHSSRHINLQTLRSIGEFRLKTLANHSLEGDETNYSKAFIAYDQFEDHNDALGFFTKTLPEDELTKLINYLLL
jgi:putative ATP-dependent endonuclease of the OLD family